MIENEKLNKRLFVLSDKADDFVSMVEFINEELHNGDAEAVSDLLNDIRVTLSDSMEEVEAAAKIVEGLDAAGPGV